MTRDQQQLAIWCGAAVVALAVCGWILSSRSVGLEESRAKADALYTDYRKLYPDQGTPADEALREVTRLRDHQAQARKDAETGLVAVLPADYQRSGVNDASSKLGSDVTALKQRAERQRIALPAKLPYEAGLETDPARASLQLANLYLYRQVLDACMDVGVAKINDVKEGKGYRDMSGLYAVITCDVTIEGSYDALTGLLDHLRSKHASGIGVRELRLTHGQQICTATVGASLLTVNNPAWQLPAIAPTVPRKGSATNVPTATPTETQPRRSRLGGG